MIEKLTCILFDECDKDRLSLASLLEEIDFIEIIRNTNTLKEALILVNDLEPNLMFLAVKADDSAAFKFLEKIKKQPTIVFSLDKHTNPETFDIANLRYLKKPYSLKTVQQLLGDLQKTHQQLANKMQGLLAKLKLSD